MNELKWIKSVHERGKRIHSPRLLAFFVYEENKHTRLSKKREKKGSSRPPRTKEEELEKNETRLPII